MRSIIGSISIATIGVAAVFYPLVPGKFDATAALSMAALAAATIAGALIAPIGLLWLMISSRCLSSSRAWASSASSFNTAPLYLIVIPCVVVIARLAYVERAAQWSRNRVIAASAAFIEDIEAYRRTHGHCPVSVASLNPDYPTRTIGVDRLRYEPAGDVHNVCFKHVSSRLDTHEIVMYNPKGEQQATSHEADILQFSPERLNQTRGCFAVEEVGAPHWKAFLFD